MAAKKITDEQWKFAKTMWQVEPLKTLTQIAESLGVTKQLVARKAKEQGWEKGASLDLLVERAYQLADSSSKWPGRAADDESSGVPLDRTTGVVGEMALNGCSTTSGPLSAFELQQIAVRDAAGKRASVLERHRNEINGVRKLVYEAIKGSGDIEKARLAKVAAETMKLLQEAERKSWGFDREDNKPAPVVIIERRRRNVINP